MDRIEYEVRHILIQKRKFQGLLFLFSERKKIKG